MTFGFLIGSRNFINLIWVSWEDFVLHGWDCNHWVAKSCTTTAYRWLLRDSLPSQRILWSAVIKSPKFFRSGHDCTSTSSTRSPRYFRLHADITSCVLRKVRVGTMLTDPRFHFLLATPSAIHEKNWKLEVSRSWGGGVLRGFTGRRSSTRFSLNSCSPSSKSCNKSLCTSTRPSLLFFFGFCWLMQRVSPKLFTRTSTSFWYWIFGKPVDIKYGILWWRWWRRCGRCRGTRW